MTAAVVRMLRKRQKERRRQQQEQSLANRGTAGHIFHHPLASAAGFGFGLGEGVAKRAGQAMASRGGAELLFRANSIQEAQREAAKWRKKGYTVRICGPLT